MITEFRISTDFPHLHSGRKFRQDQKFRDQASLRCCCGIWQGEMVSEGRSTNPFGMMAFSAVLFAARGGAVQ
jgi:hypothetical protein